MMTALKDTEKLSNIAISLLKKVPVPIQIFRNKRGHPNFTIAEMYCYEHMSFGLKIVLSFNASIDNVCRIFENIVQHVIADIKGIIKNSTFSCSVPLVY